MILICTDSCKLLYNLALCYLASGNLWLSFLGERGEAKSPEAEMESVLYITNATATTLFTSLHLFFFFFFLYVRDKKVFSGRPGPGICFCDVSEEQDAPIPHGDKWAFD